MNAKFSNLASKEAAYLAAQLEEVASRERESVWIGDGHHKGTTVFVSRSHKREFHAYDHEGRGLVEGIDRLVLIEGDGTDGDENGLNHRDSLIGCDLDTRNGLWLCALESGEEINLPGECILVWDSAS